MADVLGSMVVQDITYTQAHHGLAFKITYQNGGVAGAETVRLNGTELIFKIASGTSTATQVLACLNASAQAKTIVTGAITGTAGTAQVSCVQAFLSGGALAVKAQLPVKYGMYLVANTAGTGGNSLRFRFTSGNTGGAATVTASGNDVTCQIENGVTLYSTVFAAINADSDSNALFHAFSPQDLHSFTATSADMSSLTALAGGTAASNQAVTVQNLVYTSTTVGPSAKRQSVTYTIGATAGAEVVTLDTNGNETIQIQNGVSTATQIKAAHDASAPALALRTVATTGTASTAQKTVNQLATVASEDITATGPWEYPDVYRVDQIS